MKLISQESSPWSYDIIGGQCIGTREHTLKLVELASEFRFDRFIPYVGRLNSVEFGGVAPGHLMFSMAATRNGDEWKIKATLRESDHDITCLTIATFRDGRVGFKEYPLYSIADFHDILPRVEPFPDTTFTGSYSITRGS